MLIDCDRCGIRGAGCSGCLVTALLDTGSPTADLDAAEHRAIEVFARAGFEVEVLCSVPAARRRRGSPRRVA
ncbi:hypothetical protein DLE60_23945 [Micromonospora globispora]|uniref:Uncharacterized protein n=1 Tax=Micromonospora globispora TaxID=1450148 RepID=A0A317K6Y9_9ACTN|nr:hypothetical protein [Micromonospora globispora]PWU48148.1 hypothetical protein DLJ46_12670 [Micromonospora globispora]PWU57724.1 hypothetical protein DLE60_23945 [Micromonospora globispora]RQW84743.1 hypothetical protein DKL51_29510 [Micromonospora globispora]